MKKAVSILILVGLLLAGCNSIQIDFESGQSIFQMDLNLAETPTGISPTITPLPANSTISATRTPTLLPTPAPELPAEEMVSTTIREIAAGGKHACALFQDGAVWCWGKNEFGQLGDGSTIDSFSPIRVKGLFGRTTALTAGWAHTCALSDAGSVQCWGFNKFGELGNGSSLNRAQPMSVQGLTKDVRAIAAGDDHTCALMADGTLRCWGYNVTGQLGDNTLVNSIVPVMVLGMAHPITAVTAGWGHTCALSDQSGILCWGDNAYGQLGDGKNLAYRSSAGVVPGLENNVTALSARGGHTCALLSTGGVQCWGYNLNGELGDGTLENRDRPVRVSGLSAGAIGITAGGTHTCALIRGGGVVCWGRNYHGQLGNDSKISRLTPVSVSGLQQPVKQMALGTEFSCALTNDGKVNCWGQNSEGELGDGTQTDSALPNTTDIFSMAGSETVLPEGNASPIAAGGQHSCWITKSGGAQCWGNNQSGQLGNGKTADSSLPVDVIGLTSGVLGLAAGGDHTCALLLDGGVRCWGANYSGELGNRSYEDSSVPVEVDGLEDGGARAIAAGGGHTCAVLTDGGVACWGANNNGQLALPFGSTSTIPSRVAGIPGAAYSISALWDHTCVLTENGGVYCWGLNNHGQLGTGNIDPQAGPVQVLGMDRGYTAISAGGSHTCAVSKEGGVMCWGKGGDGQLGYLNMADQPSPVPVTRPAGSPGAVAVTAGSAHTCLLTAEGAVWCWGSGGGGQLGDGRTWNSPTPVSVTDLDSGVSFLQAGDRHTCALVEDWMIKCWGNNWVGQLGNGDRYNSSVPVDVKGWNP